MDMHGNNIKKLRQAKGLSQESLGEMIGLTKMSVGRLENGKQALTQAHMANLSNALGCTINDILGQEPEADQSGTESKTDTGDVRLAVELVLQAAEDSGGEFSPAQISQIVADVISESQSGRGVVDDGPTLAAYFIRKHQTNI